MANLINWEGRYEISILNNNIKTKGYEKDCDNDDGSVDGYCCLDCLHE
jgi:hypothetical protein